MALTKEELIGSLQHEINVLLHLASKIDPAKVDYRPTEQQRSTLQLLQYLTYMGPQIVTGVTAGGFDPVAFTAAENAAKALNLEQAVAEIRKQRDFYAESLGAYSEDDFRTQIDMFGQ